MGTNLTTRVENMERDLYNVQDLVSRNYNSTTEMLDPHNFSFLYKYVSTSVVEILCIEKINGQPGDADHMFLCPGFIVNSTPDYLILTSAKLMSSRGIGNWTLDSLDATHIIYVTCRDESGGQARLVHLDLEHDIAMLRMPNKTGRPSLKFFAEESYNCKLQGMPIFTISQPHIVYTESYIPSIGRISQRCIPPRQMMLHRDCDLFMYELRTLDKGVVGAPILNFAGDVVGFHSSVRGTCSFGVGLKSIKKAFVEYFRLSESESLSINDVIEEGLKCRPSW